MLTDRDIAVRGLAKGDDADKTTVREVMTREVRGLRSTESTEEAAKVMAEWQIRRLPVLDENGKVVGIVSLADIARSEPTGLVGETVKAISEPPGAQA